MAKKKPEASPAKVKPASRAKAVKAKTTKPATLFDEGGAAPAPKKRAAKAAAKPKAEPIEVSPELIGYTAGEVWRVLSEGGVLTLPALKKAADAPAELVLLALGWLAREDKLSFELDGREVSISLR